MSRKKPDSFGQRNYRDGAFERVGEAAMLLRAEQFAGAIYLAGRAVEGMLRALIWKYDTEVQQGKKSLETGHDFRELLRTVRGLRLGGRQANDSALENNIQHVGRLWYNNMRFASSKYVERRWLAVGEVHKSRTMKQAAKDYFDACSDVVRRCEVLCER